MRRAARGLAALAAAGLASCVSFDWDRVQVDQPVPDEVLERMPAPGTELAACLELLGAPNLVWEYRVHGLVMAWTWHYGRTLGATVQIPVTQDESFSFSYDDIRAKQRAVVLWFDADWRLESWNRGLLGELVELSAPPASVEDIEAIG